MPPTSPPAPIETPRHPVTSTYHGITVTEDYRWLEDATADPTRAWTQAQSERTRGYLDNLPCHGAVRRRAAEILTSESVGYDLPLKAGSTYFALKDQPPKQQPFLVTLTSLDDLSGERVLVDPNLLDEGGTTTIDWYQPSPDGSLVAVSLSAHGTEDGTLHVYDTVTGEPVAVPVPRVHGGTAGGSMAWTRDSSGFWYTRYPAPGERPDEELDFFQDVWFHPIGDSLEKDRRELAGLFADNRIAENFLSASPDGRWVMDRVQKGDGGEWEIFVRSQGEGSWWQVAKTADQCVYASFGPDSIYLVSRRDAPHGKVLRLQLAEGVVATDAALVVPPAAVTIEGAGLGSPFTGGLAVTDTRLWLLDMDGGSSSVRVFGLEGETVGDVSVPAVSAIDNLVRLDHDAVVWAREWHHGGRLEVKQNVFDDFAACARHLAATGLTSVDRLAIMGGSNGGLLMGAVLTQHPTSLGPWSRWCRCWTCCGWSCTLTVPSTSPSSGLWRIRSCSRRCTRTRRITMSRMRRHTRLFC